MKAKIKTIDVQAKEWFDKVNGNSYFSCLITVNYGLKSELKFTLPFQYGYGSHYQDIAFRTIKSNINKKILKDFKSSSLWRFCDENGILLRSSKQENCKKRELLH